MGRGGGVEAFSALVVALTLVYVATLPGDYEINTMAPVINAPREKVFKYLADPRNFANLAPEELQCGALRSTRTSCIFRLRSLRSLSSLPAALSHHCRSISPLLMARPQACAGADRDGGVLAPLRQLHARLAR